MKGHCHVNKPEFQCQRAPKVNRVCMLVLRWFVITTTTKSHSGLLHHNVTATHALLPPLNTTSISGNWGNSKHGVDI